MANKNVRPHLLVTADMSKTINFSRSEYYHVLTSTHTHTPHTVCILIIHLLETEYLTEYKHMVHTIDTHNRLQLHLRTNSRTNKYTETNSECTYCLWHNTVNLVQHTNDYSGRWRNLLHCDEKKEEFERFDSFDKRK